jgi:hypothetical protein
MIAMVFAGTSAALAIGALCYAICALTVGRRLTASDVARDSEMASTPSSI